MTLMRVSRVVAALVVAAWLVAPGVAQTKTDKELVVYAYDSFVSDWGLGPKVVPLFEKATGVKVRLVSKGDGGQVLSALVLEKGAPRADLVIGLDNNQLPRALAAGVLEPYAPKNLALIDPAVDFDPSHHLIPFDYGWFSLVWDSEKLAAPPARLADLAKPEFARKLILMDPRTSTPGLGFLAMVVAARGGEWPAMWKALKPSILTVTTGWDQGYGMFTNGEAPLVISYTTSPAYHVEYDKTKRYQAVVFPEGLPRQVEGAGVVKGAKNRDAARAFLEFMLTEEFQREVPTAQWMYPVNPRVKLPASFDVAPKPSKTLVVPQAELDKALAAWADAAVR